MGCRNHATTRSLLGSWLAIGLLALGPQLVGCSGSEDTSDVVLATDDAGDVTVEDTSVDTSEEEVSTSKCGNGNVESGEACDDGQNNSVNGPCLPTCKLACGDGVVQSTEKCDTKLAAGTTGACPVACANPPSCQVGKVVGNDCQTACEYGPITDCTTGDGCCGSGCNAANDAECTAVCGNGTLEPGETCDPSGTCPVSCDDSNACTTDTTSGTAAACNVACGHDPITVCSMTSDGCCAGGCDATTDVDCSPTCGNGVLEGTETCDDGNPDGAAPSVPCATLAACEDSNACTVDTYTGAAAQCSAVCSHTDITSCTPGDGCCAAGCTSVTDADCSSVCGNALKESGELCDTGIATGAGSCPTVASCADSNACTTDTLSGSDCLQQCSNTPITTCVGGDGCCAPGCNGTNDSDCSASCGNGVKEPGETCDTGIATGADSCPTVASCADTSACTADSVINSACQQACANVPITACVLASDGCCPTGCNATNDGDCSASCGNAVVEAGEKCDTGIASGAGSCPTVASCADTNACTIDGVSGATCQAQCSYTNVTACSGNTLDGCCPTGCTNGTDKDCSASCGDGIVNGTEQCDKAITAGQPGACPTTCNDSNVCTTDTLSGSAANCSATCTSTAITACSTTSDGCCPAGCNQTNDANCAAVCGNGVVEAGENCDKTIAAGSAGACPAACNDNNACTADVLTGTAAACTAKCTSTAISACSLTGDGCCPSGCNQTTDADCSAVCGNGVLEAGELCDTTIAAGAGSCPTVASCNDTVACTADSVSGSGCQQACAHPPITACTAGDGCCPTACNQSTDSDCAAACGNSVLESGETCDPPSSCPANVAACSDGLACTTDTYSGSAALCTAACGHAAITACSLASDGCCPSTCTSATDADCVLTVSAASAVTAGTCLTAATTAKTPVVVTLLDTNGGAVNGATVTITATAGTVSAVSATGNKYWAILQAPAAVGPASTTVTVVANGVTLTTKPVVTLATPFTDLAGGAGGCSAQGNLRVRVVDAIGNAISGANVMVGGAQNLAAYATTYGAAAAAANTGTTSATGYAEFLDYGTALTGNQMITAVANNYFYFTFADLNAADVVIPLDLIKPVVQKGTTQGSFTTVTAPSGDPIEFGIMLPDTNLKALANLSLASLLGDNQCYAAGGVAGNMNIPSNVFIPSQCAASLLFCVQNLPLHNYVSPTMSYGGHMLTGLFGSAPLNALTGTGGIAAGLPSITLNKSGAVNPYTVAAAGPTTQNIDMAQTDLKDVTCSLGNLPAVADVFCATAVDYDSAGSAGALLPGEGRLGLTGFKAATLTGAATTATVASAPRVPKTGPFASTDYLGAIAALYLDKARTGIVPGTANGVTAVIKRTAPYSATGGGTMTATDFMPIRAMTQTTRTAGLGATPAAPSATADFVIHTFTQDVSTAYTTAAPCSAAQTHKDSYTLWKVYAPGSNVAVALPTLPASWPAAGAGGNYAGLVNPATTTEDDVVSWQTMTVHETRASAFNYNNFVVKEFTKYATHISTNNLDWL